MVKIIVCCVNCKKDFSFNTEDPSLLWEIYKSEDSPRICIPSCYHCGKPNRVKVPA